VYKQSEAEHHLGGKGKDRVMLIKFLINARVWKRHFGGHAIKNLKELVYLTFVGW